MSAIVRSQMDKTVESKMKAGSKKTLNPKARSLNPIDFRV